MIIKDILKHIVLVLTTGVLLSSCYQEEAEPKDETTQEAKTNIEWEVFLEFDEGVTALNFTISEDAKWVFYTDAFNSIHRVNKVSGESKVLFSESSGPSYVHHINQKLYLFYERNYRSYCGVSTDYGETIVEHHVGTYTNFAAGWYDGAFMRLIVNRMFVLPNGDLILPHILKSTNNATFLNDEQLIAISSDGGASWRRKDSENSYIAAQKNNRLYALSEGWTGVQFFPSEILVSDNTGDSWQVQDLPYRPQAVDRENNLIGGLRNEIQRLNGNEWSIYTWEESEMPLVSLKGLRYEGERGDDPNGRQMDDFEFDAQNNLYVLGKSGSNICKTMLN